MDASVIMSSPTNSGQFFRLGKPQKTKMKLSGVEIEITNPSVKLTIKNNLPLS